MAKLLDLPKELQQKIFALAMTPPSVYDDRPHALSPATPSRLLQPRVLNLALTCRKFNEQTLTAYFVENQLSAVLQESVYTSGARIMRIRHGTFEDRKRVFQLHTRKLKVSVTGLWHMDSMWRFVAKVQSLLRMCVSLTELTVLLDEVKTTFVLAIQVGLEETVRQLVTTRNKKIKVHFVGTPRLKCFP
jgi:hypothetical protein